MKDLRHDNLITLVDSFVEIQVLDNTDYKPSVKDQGYLHIVMDYAENGDVY